MAKRKSGVNTTVTAGHENLPQKVEMSTADRHKISMWWEPSNTGNKKVSDAVIALVDTLLTEQRPRLDRLERHMRLYGGRNFQSLKARDYHKNRSVNTDGMVAFNGIQSVVDTVLSKVARNKPLPQFLTENGNFEERIRAKKLSRYVAGVFYDQKVYSQGSYVSMSACILGTGMFYPYRDGDRVRVEWVFPQEVLVDDEEAFYGAPGNVFRIKNVPRMALAAKFPDHAAAIAAAKVVSDLPTSNSSVDHLRVIEAWHLASSPGVPDGRHVIVVEGATLHDEVYKRVYDPFIRLHWSAPLLGWWGRGIAQELTGLQVEVNRLLIKIQKTFHLAAVPWVLLPTGANVSTADIRNDLGLIIRYAGNTPPKIQTHQTVSPEVFSHLERLTRMMFEKAGVSQMAATAQKPPGLESGIALREYNDIGDERLLLFGQAHENMYLEIAQRVVDISREIADDTKMKEGEGKLRVRAPGQRAFDNISWKDVDLDDESYVMQVFPISSLPTSPAGRKDEVLDLLGAGLIPHAVAMSLLDYPDLAAEENLQLAAIENINWVISEILESGRFHPPQPFQDLELGVQRLNAAYLMAMTDGAPDKKLKLIRTWIMGAQTMLASAAASQALQEGAPLPGADGQGGAVGAPPPQQAAPPPGLDAVA